MNFSVIYAWRLCIEACEYIIILAICIFAVFYYLIMIVYYLYMYPLKPFNSNNYMLYIPTYPFLEIALSFLDGEHYKKDHD